MSRSPSDNESSGSRERRALGVGGLEGQQRLGLTGAESLLSHRGLGRKNSLELQQQDEEVHFAECRLDGQVGTSHFSGFFSRQSFTSCKQNRLLGRY